eukprot:291621-Alexandrium_andersonii.AAC.1
MAPKKRAGAAIAETPKKRTANTAEAPLKDEAAKVGSEIKQKLRDRDLGFPQPDHRRARIRL